MPSADLIKDMLTVKRRLLVPLLSPVPAPAGIRKLLTNQRRNGSWPEVDYKNQDTTLWKPIEHLRNCLEMAQAYAAPRSSLCGNPDLRAGLNRGLDYWLKHDFQRPWWYNSIGVPGVLGNIMLLFEEELTQRQLADGAKILGRATLTATGQNLVWMSSITAIRGILQRDPDLVRRAYAFIADEIRVSRGEGIQQDFSFHQHGPCLYNHGYGAGFSSDGSRLACLVADTAFAFPQEKIDILANYVLEGSQWLARGDTPEYGAKGREITRSGASAGYLSGVAKTMLKLPTGREEELKALAARAGGRKADPLVGNRHFWCTDIMVHHRPAYMASARFYSTRIANTDGLSGCDEGQMSHYLSDGCNYLYRTGKEYRDIFPVWDWQKVPGTTVEQIPEHRGEPRRMGTTSFVGGVSNGQYGVAAFDFQRDALAARKSWFFFDDQYVCLGSGITSTSGNSVATTLNQCHLKGRAVVVADGRRKAMESGSLRLSGPTWVHHDRVGYILLEADRVNLRCGRQSGSWHRISTQRSDRRISLPVFKLWIDHGKSPKDASYAYVVAPDASATELKAQSEKLPIRVIKNTPDLQAARHGRLGVTGVAFYKPGKIDLGRGLTISVDRACLVLLRRKGRALEVSVSNPKNRKLKVTVTMGLGLSGPRCRQLKSGVSRLVFDLPGGMVAGKSVTQRYEVA
jgi:chondroitin AC lyase